MDTAPRAWDCVTGAPEGKGEEGQRRGCPIGDDEEPHSAAGGGCTLRTEKRSA